MRLPTVASRSSQQLTSPLQRSLPLPDPSRTVHLLHGRHSMAIFAARQPSLDRLAAALGAVAWFPLLLASIGLAMTRISSTLRRKETGTRFRNSTIPDRSLRIVSRCPARIEPCSPGLVSL